MKKRFFSAMISVVLIVAIASGVIIPNALNPIESIADSNVYNFNYGSGIKWNNEDELPTFAPITATNENPMDAINVKDRPANIKFAMASLQGIVNRTRPQILVLNSADNGSQAFWPNELVGKDKYKIITTATLSDYTIYYNLINKYKSYIKGMIVYNSNIQGTMNVATSIAGATDCLVVDAALATKITTNCKLNTILNFNQMPEIKNDLDAYNYLYTNYFQTGKLNKRLFIGLHPKDHNPFLRDLAVATKSIVLWLKPDDATQKTVLDKFYTQATAGVTYGMGWWPDEDPGVCYATRNGVSFVPSDYFENATVYMAGEKKFQIPEVPAKPELQNKLYIALAQSDGDNLQYNQHAMVEKDLWNHPLYRQKYPISWTISPALYYAAPQMLNYYMKSAGNNCLISGPSGMGYTKSTRWREKAGFLDKFIASTDKINEKTGINIITLWDRISEETYSVLASKSKSLLGVTVNNNDFNDSDTTNPDSMFDGGYKHYPENGAFAYKSELPILGLGNGWGYNADWYVNGNLMALGKDIMRQNLFAVAESYDGSAPAFRLSQAVPWNVKVKDLYEIARDLKAAYPDKIEFVRADHLFMLANEYNNVPFNVALQKNVTTSNSDNLNKMGNDGSISTGWSSSNSGDKWYQVDLGQRCNLNRYVLKNAETAYYSAANNTKDYEIQCSIDGNNWIVADKVNNNKEDIVYKSFTASTSARYVRVKINNPGADGVARIQDFEVYGNPTSASKDELTTLVNQSKTLTKTNYSCSDSVWNEFQQAITSAQTVVDNNTADKVAIEGAYSALKVKNDSINVFNKSLALNINKTSLYILPKSAYSLTASISPTILNKYEISWKSSNLKIATVDSSGAVKAVGSGTATVTVYLKDNPAVYKTCIITVPYPVSSVNLNKKTVTIQKGKKVSVKATVSPKNAYNSKLTWNTSSKNIATVSSGTIKGIFGGVATITATAGSKKATIKVYVNGLSKGNTAYFKSGKKLKNKWVKESGKWYYVDKKGKIIKKKSYKLGSKVYKFTKTGVCTNKK